ncbi:MAG: GMP synthase [Candidatus Pelagadaptatus aseana]|uniref:glutamine amidotransferase-related protein n=1 Tax=Candidatus Pelagadaptatus aseana TaxID=3120508 RepID=UPI0039B1F51D
MKIGILATGITPDELIDDFGSYAYMFEQLFGALDSGFEFETFDVREGDFPAAADVCDGWVITGSKFNVYQNLDWMVRLKQLILEIHKVRKPMVGICFGHQIVAEAFGGKVDKYEGGWGVGLHTYQLCGDKPWLDKESPSFTINAMHQDQVIEKPEAAEVVAESDFCRYAALNYDDLILTFQAHPEFSISYEYQLVQARRGDVIPEQYTDPGLAGLREHGAMAESLRVGRWMEAFLKQGL